MQDNDAIQCVILQRDVLYVRSDGGACVLGMVAGGKEVKLLKVHRWQCQSKRFGVIRVGPEVRNERRTGQHELRRWVDEKVVAHNTMSIHYSTVWAAKLAPPCDRPCRDARTTAWAHEDFVLRTNLAERDSR
eukprot:CAMPEP_0119319204 /NCGR_PEP_ID=MMETSP1333-20130426/48731_1 /TAXON_ID=418940 /ORGANISM="Scyphosphaera apsteinii, Strain RCC1455" /LENGTH=131 /DNA_ID=CAMNT_0007325559 /DNA_START=537 /DNA_END=932 /DNA_ORIENTATION=-